MERISTHEVFDELEVPMRHRPSQTIRLSRVMRQLGWSNVRARGLNRGSYRDRVRGFAREAGGGVTLAGNFPALCSARGARGRRSVRDEPHRPTMPVRARSRHDRQGVKSRPTEPVEAARKPVGERFGFRLADLHMPASGSLCALLDQ